MTEAIVNKEASPHLFSYSFFFLIHLFYGGKEECRRECEYECECSIYIYMRDLTIHREMSHLLYNWHIPHHIIPWIRKHIIYKCIITSTLIIQCFFFFEFRHHHLLLLLLFKFLIKISSSQWFFGFKSTILNSIRDCSHYSNKIMHVCNLNKIS